MDGNSARFDMFAWQVVPWPVLREDVRCLETLDIGTIWLGDAYAAPGMPVLEAWTTLAMLANCTSRVRLGTMVTDVSLRHPALLAKQAATVDCLSEGRLDLGVGPGDNRPPQHLAWLGSPSLTPGDRVDRFREAVEVIDRLLRDRQLSYHGAYYHLNEAPLTPAPMQQPRPPLTIAAQGKRALQVVAAHADVWISWPAGKTPEQALQSVRERNRLLDECCRAIGRDPATVERACFTGWVAPDAPFVSAEAFKDFVGRYREAGVQRFVFSFGSAAYPAPYDGWVATGRWASREALDAFAADLIRDLSSQRNSL
jgi:alkanesulfonate monooxygenase SsuD/methylene tetrahydromethanopterin reductase-like flavin-dependent oxidoreductase (luciferase family)